MGGKEENIKVGPRVLVTGGKQSGMINENGEFLKETGGRRGGQKGTAGRRNDQFCFVYAEFQAIAKEPNEDVLEAAGSGRLEGVMYILGSQQCLDPWPQFIK